MRFAMQVGTVCGVRAGSNENSKYRTENNDL